MLKNPEDVKKEVHEKVRTIVVKELPMQPIRETKADDGTLIRFVTVEEALTAVLNEEE